MARYKQINNERIQLTAEEEAALDAKEKAWSDKSAERKLSRIKKIRLQKLQETDYMANSDYTMPDDVKTWRQTMRDIPANYTTEAKYDEVLARDEDGNLTHSVWKK
jgi:hypothetical protein